jgi:hypothetical protein
MARKKKKKQPVRLQIDRLGGNRTTVPARLRYKMKARYAFHCQKCEDQFHSKDLHVHHIRPRGAGGNNDPDNLLPICLACHGEIHARNYSEGNLYRLDGKLLYYTEELHTFIQKATYRYETGDIRVWLISNFAQFSPDPETRYECYSHKREIYHPLGSELFDTQLVTTLLSS